MRIRYFAMVGCCLSILLTGCVTSIDAELPYAELPQITVATEFSLVASPAYPTSYLPIDPIPAGAQVQVIGVDEDAAWLLVEYEGVLGWMPAFYSRTNLATLEPALVFEPPADKCATFLDATLSPDEVWTANSVKSAIVIGSIFRTEAGDEFADASIQLTIDGPGSATSADYIHTPLTEDTGVALFSYTLQYLQDDSEIQFNLKDTGDEPYSFQALFFKNECATGTYTLPIGQLRGIVANTDVGQHRAVVQPTTPPTPQSATPTPKAIKHGSGPKSSSVLDIAITIYDEDWNIYLREAGQKANTIITTDSAQDYFNAWSPDGEQFVFSSDRSGIDQLYIYDVKTDNIVQQLTSSPGTTWHGSWSPSDPEIVYQEGDSESWQLWNVDLTTLTTRRLTTRGSSANPHWSPDGANIVFSAARRDTDGDGDIDFDDEGHLFIIDADGKNPAALTDDDGYFDEFPRWMLDRRYVVFSRHIKGDKYEENGPGEICIVDVETGQVRTLTFTSANEIRAYPSPLGDQFLILVEEDDRYELHLADWDGQRLGRRTYIADALNSDWRPLVSE